MSWQLSVERVVVGLNYELVEIKKNASGLLQVFIDFPSEVSGEKLINLEDCEKVTRQLQYVLEVEGCAYERLEVSSPGLDRLLRNYSDYLRFEGERVDVVLKAAFLDKKRYSGWLHSANEAWQLLLDENNKALAAFKKPTVKGELTLRFTLDEVQEVRLSPVLNFKGRCSAKKNNLPNSVAIPGGALLNNEFDGGFIS
jgi:ribosome maturation factor RimP